MCTDYIQCSPQLNMSVQTFMSKNLMQLCSFKKKMTEKQGKKNLPRNKNLLQQSPKLILQMYRIFKNRKGDVYPFIHTMNLGQAKN